MNFRPNDLVAVGPDQFIYTNDGIAQSESGNFLEMITGYNGASVYYWDGKVYSQIKTKATVRFRSHTDSSRA